MQKVHFIGIEGIGMSALANILLSSDIQVTGSDLKPGIQCSELRKKGAVIYKGHKAENLAVDVDVVVYSEAIRRSNPELSEAYDRNLTVRSYANMLGFLMQEKIGIAVAGTHGKSTTSGMLAYLLEKAGLSPTFVVGARVNQLGGNSAPGAGDYFVAEACEFSRSFLNLSPQMAIITNIEEDHLDYYKDLNEIASAFTEFSRKIPQNGILVVDKQAYDLLPADLACHVETYSISEASDWQISGLVTDPYGQTFEVVYRGQNMGIYATKLPGFHNLRNTLSVIAMAHHLNIPKARVQNILGTYRGVGRRFETISDAPITIIDDYAHHPTEIKATLQGARDRFGFAKIWCIFQPHQASRTYHFLEDFAKSFALADEVIIADIFYARDSKEDRSRVHSSDLAEAIRKNGQSVYQISPFPAIVEFLQNCCQPEDVVLTLGAGDIWQVSSMLSNAIAITMSFTNSVAV